jgi:hypothetical protein
LGQLVIRNATLSLLGLILDLPEANAHFTPLHLGAAAMKLYQAELVATYDDQSSKTCRFCDEKLRHVRTMVIVETGAVIHMFQCRCGERMWVE